MSEGLDSRYTTPQESPGFLLWQVTNLWQRRQRAALKSLGLTHVQFVLLAGIVWLSRDDEPVTQARLAQHAQTDPMMTSQVVRTLERKGLVRRAAHPRDSRAKSLHGTSQGLELAKRATVLVEQTDDAFFSSLKESSACLVELLQHLLAETDTEHPSDE
jgi:MarR family transcriptional regulator, organic hydroperoxide resistance regulator